MLGLENLRNWKCCPVEPGLSGQPGRLRNDLASVPVLSAGQRSPLGSEGFKGCSVFSYKAFLNNPQNEKTEVKVNLGLNSGDI